MLTFVEYVSNKIFESAKPTPQLKNLKKDELIEFLETFIYSLDDLDVTEKVAGQQLKAKYDAQAKQTYVASKNVKEWKTPDEYKYNTDVMKVLDKFFKEEDKDMELTLEVISEEVSHDFINYNIKGKIVVDFSGVLTNKDIEKLNKMDKKIHFIPKDGIKIQHTKGIEHIKKLFETKWKKEIMSMKTLKDLRSLILPEIQNTLGEYIANEFNSALNSSSAVEGFFMNFKGKNLKIPNKTFADLQRMNVKMVNVFKRMPKSKVKERIVNPDDQILKDMIQFLEDNIKFKTKDESQYKRLMSAEDSKEILDEYKKDNDPIKLFNKMSKIIKKG